ncbi:AFG1-like ATPase [Linum perenne]
MRRVYSISSSIAKLGFVRRTRISSTFRFSARQFCDRSPKPQGLLARYKEFVGEGKLQHDPYQERVAIELEKLLGRLEQYERDMEEYHAKLTKWEEDRENERRKLMRNEAEQKQDGGKQSSKLLERWIFGKRPENVEPGVGKWVSYLNRERKLDSLVGRRPTTPAAPKGLYIYGNVGSGKTMLMDMFYGATAGVVKHRRRFHFHETIDVFAIVALSGILGRLLATGTVLVATSNRAPKDLNQDDMQREIFHKLLTKIEEHCETILIGSEIDYRRFAAQRCENQVTYFWPLESSALNQYEKMWSQVTEQLGGRITSVTIPVMFGRKLKVPESCKGVARFPFEHLCGRPLGAADYIAVTRNYHTVFISDIPAMSMRIRDKARRFITLVDELYNHHCCLVCSASASIEDLFHGTEEGTLFDLESFQFETDIEGGKLRRDVLAEGKLGDRGAPSTIISMMSGREESFAFRRAVSRLIEMQTPLYQEGVRTLHPYFQGQVGYGSPSTSRPRVST